MGARRACWIAATGWTLCLALWGNGPLAWAQQGGEPNRGGTFGPQPAPPSGSNPGASNFNGQPGNFNPQAGQGPYGPARPQPNGQFQPGQPGSNGQFQPGAPQIARNPGQPQPGQMQPGQHQPGPQGQGQPATAQPGNVALPRAPFQLSQQEAQDLYAILVAWEKCSTEVETMRCELVVWEYNSTFNKDKGVQRVGELKFHAPDKGLYRIKLPSHDEWDEHWVCDGKAIFSFDAAEKRLTQRDLPPDLQGKRIIDGPLPFLFGADANRLMQRYFMRIIPPPAGVHDQVWIEAYPKFQADAANFSRARVILTVTKDQKLVPFAIETYDPRGTNRKVHQFVKPAINERSWSTLFTGNDFAVKAPSGWTRVVNPEAQVRPVSGQPGGAGNPQGGPGGPPYTAPATQRAPEASSARRPGFPQR